MYVIYLLGGGTEPEIVVSETPCLFFRYPSESQWIVPGTVTD